MPKQGEKTGCKECQYFEPKGLDGHSECHLHPPTVIARNLGDDEDVINSAFPYMHPDSWCNDWRLNTGPRK